MESLLELVNNPIEIFEDTTDLLIKIADNIIKYPRNLKMRVLQKANYTVSEKILNVTGGANCLKAMGFQEEEDTFQLPVTSSLETLKEVRDGLYKLKHGSQSNGANPEGSTITSSSDNETNPQSNDKPAEKPQNQQSNVFTPTETFKQISLPPVQYMFKEQFLQTIEGYFHRVLIYEDKYLQQRALSVIPLYVLQINANDAFRNFQLRIKQENLQDPEIDLPDFMILELLKWFKSEFFTWVNTPDCQKCSGHTTFSHMSADKAMHQFTDRVEMHKCDKCGEFTPFPRYNDPNILLETRKGRCGEWANVFTLMCRALGWDARLVVDLNDHIWTEVYSFSQKKWLHCDPCENVCDKPLLYEVGWGKKPSYIMAYSCEELQDVTWRYSKDHKAVLKRRNKIKENELINAMMCLRKKRQEGLTKHRREYLAKRMLSELFELMIEKKPSAGEENGRTSGSIDWRLSRGETKATVSEEFTWKFKNAELLQGVTIQYSSVLDKYERIQGDGSKEVLEGWATGVYKSKGIFRKVENDWKKSYICRTEASDQGELSWKFQVIDEQFVIDKIDYTIKSDIFEKGCVSINICNNNTSSQINSGTGVLETFHGSREITVNVTLSGGSGGSAWQHAQLFRQDLNSTDFPFKILFTFKQQIA